MIAAPIPEQLTWCQRYMRLTGQLVRGRKASNLTQDEIAARCMTSRRTFQRWEDGQAVPNAMQLFQWADAVGVDLTSAPRASILTL